MEYYFKRHVNILIPYSMGVVYAIPRLISVILCNTSFQDIPSPDPI